MSLSNESATSGQPSAEPYNRHALRVLFNACDPQNTGAITKANLLDGCRRLDLNDLTESDADALFTELDVGGGGSVTFDAFAERFMAWSQQTALHDPLHADAGAGSTHEWCNTTSSGSTENADSMVEALYLAYRSDTSCAKLTKLLRDDFHWPPQRVNDLLQGLKPNCMAKEEDLQSLLLKSVLEASAEGMSPRGTSPATVGSPDNTQHAAELPEMTEEAQPLPVRSTGVAAAAAAAGKAHSTATRSARPHHYSADLNSGTESELDTNFPSLKGHDDLLVLWNKMRQTRPELLGPFSLFLDTVSQQVQDAEQQRDRMRTDLEREAKDLDRRAQQLDEEAAQQIETERTKLRVQEEDRLRRLRDEMLREVEERERKLESALQHMNGLQSKVDRMSQKEKQMESRCEELQQVKTSLESELHFQRMHQEALKAQLEGSGSGTETSRAVSRLSESDNELLERQLEHLRKTNNDLKRELQDRVDELVANEQSKRHGSSEPKPRDGWYDTDDDWSSPFKGDPLTRGRMSSTRGSMASDDDTGAPAAQYGSAALRKRMHSVEFGHHFLSMPANQLQSPVPTAMDRFLRLKSVAVDVDERGEVGFRITGYPHPVRRLDHAMVQEVSEHGVASAQGGIPKDVAAAGPALVSPSLSQGRSSFTTFSPLSSAGEEALAQHQYAPQGTPENMSQLPDASGETAQYYPGRTRRSYDAQRQWSEGAHPRQIMRLATTPSMLASDSDTSSRGYHSASRGSLAAYGYQAGYSGHGQHPMPNSYRSDPYLVEGHRPHSGAASPNAIFHSSMPSMQYPASPHLGRRFSPAVTPATAGSTCWDNNQADDRISLHSFTGLPGKGDESSSSSDEGKSPLPGHAAFVREPQARSSLRKSDFFSDTRPFQRTYSLQSHSSGPYSRSRKRRKRTEDTRVHALVPTKRAEPSPRSRPPPVPCPSPTLLRTESAFALSSPNEDKEQESAVADTPPGSGAAKPDQNGSGALTRGGPTRGSFGNLSLLEMTTEEQEASGKPDLMPMVVHPIQAGSPQHQTHKRPVSPSVARRVGIMPERVFKVVICGEAGVGKTSYIWRLCNMSAEYDGGVQATIGVDYKMKVLEMDGHITVMQLWDTAGQERFRAFTKQYFRKADGVICVYDITNYNSFVRLRKWLDDIEDATDGDVALMLLGNKSDSADVGPRPKRQVTYWQGQQQAQKAGALFAEVSAKSGHGVLETCIELAKVLYTAQEEIVSDLLTLTSGTTRPKKKERSCCI